MATSLPHSFLLDPCSRSSHGARHSLCRWMIRGQFSRQYLTQRRLTAQATYDDLAKNELSPLVALECDGIMVNLHDDGHRVAFNKTFRSLGLECANWSKEVYDDVSRSSDGTEEGLIKLYFDTVGWPSTVATSDYEALVRNIIKMKKRELKQILESKQIPLRSGVLNFIDEILDAKAKLIVMTETQSEQQDQVWECLQPLLGDRSLQIRAIQWPKFGVQKKEPVLEDNIRKDIQEMKKKEAEAFVSNINARAREKQVKIAIDPTLLSPRSQSIDPTFFLTLAASMGSSMNKTVMVGAHSPTLQMAASSGCICVAVPSGLAQRRSFPAAELVFDGFGPGGGVTWSRIVKVIGERKHI